MKILGKELTFNGNKVYHAGDKPTTSEIGALGGTAENGYMGMTHPDKSTSNWIRTTNQGLIPFSQDTTNGVSSIGTSSWPFKTVYAKTFNGALSGNAATATKLQTARTIALKGAVNGSGSFDGSGNLSINTNTRIFSGGGTGGESGYVAFAQLVITSNYVNRPIEFKLICRGKVTPCYVSLMFANANNTDPTLSSLKYWGTDYGVFAHKVGTSTWLLYYTKSESYDNVTIVGNDSASQGVTITYPGTFITTKPTTNVFDASLGGNFGAANTATTLQTARTINGTSFNGSGNITTANWGTARTITIGKTGKSVNGSGNVSWTLAEIGAANIDDATTTTSSVWSSNKTQTQINTSYNTMLKRVEALEETAYVDFVGTKGGTMTGNLNMAANINLNNEKYVYAKKANGTAYEVLGFTSTDSLIVGSLSGATTIRSSNNPRVMVGSAINTIYHEGYKPTPSAIGALATSGGTLTGSINMNLSSYSSAFKATASGKSIDIGVGGGDVYIVNSVANKYLQLKDNGVLSYSDNPIYHAGNMQPNRGYEGEHKSNDGLYYCVSLAHLDVNTWYPVVSNQLPGVGINEIRVAVHLNSGTTPSWSTHNKGFTCNLHILDKPCGWGTTDGTGLLVDNSYSFANANPAGYSQMRNASRAVLWLRGGGAYHIYTSFPAGWSIKTSTFTESQESVAPVGNYPGVSITKTEIGANLYGDVKTYNNYIKIGGSWLTIQSFAPTASVGDIWIQN